MRDGVVGPSQWKRRHRPLAEVQQPAPDQAHQTRHGDAATALLGDFGQFAPENRNILHWMFTDPAAKRLFGETWAEEARRMASLFRAAYDLWPGDTAFVALVDRIRASCLKFDAWWSEHGVGAPVSGTKHLRHPTLGLVRYEYASFQANDDPALKLALYTRR